MWNVKNKTRKKKERAMKQLLEFHPVPKGMENLFINELKSMDEEDAKDERNKLAFSRAQMLGLIAKNRSIISANN